MAEPLGAMHLQVNSLHHQAIRRLAPGLQVTSLAPDGIIEAVELAGNPFGVAVQWHPECLQEHAPMRRFFSAFAQAAQTRLSPPDKARKARPMPAPPCCADWHF